MVRTIELYNEEFHIHVDRATGAVLEILDPRAEVPLNWVSSPANAPWQPLGSRWGLGFADLGANLLHRLFWNSPRIDTSLGRDITVATYHAGPLELVVRRHLNSRTQSFTETYEFRNQGTIPLNLSATGETSFAIYTPFNDHYTNTSDALRSRTHAHLWVNGGSSAWVKLSQMGGHGRDLGLVLTRGSLSGYSIESRDEVTHSNTRGVFLLHPSIPVLEPGQSSIIEWTLFWHNDWDNFFAQCARRSSQFIHFDIPKHTLVCGESVKVRMTGDAAAINSATTVNGQRVQQDGSSFAFFHHAGDMGQKTLRVITGQGGDQKESIVYLNTVPRFDDLIKRRIEFIVEKQQVRDADNLLHGAYVVYDNQAEAFPFYETQQDRNAGRERVGMGVLIGRWLKKTPESTLRGSFMAYYTFVCTKLQDDSGFVFDAPFGTGTYKNKRLYNWPWVLQLHLVAATIGIPAISGKSPITRFMETLERFYDEGGASLYAIGLPILEGLRALKAAGDEKSFNRAKNLFVSHGQKILQRGTNYPPFEVNFEQSIVAPAAIILLELYRATGDTIWLSAAKLQIEVLLRFAGKQPDYRLYDVSIRHWDGHWFGKDRTWGDTFPHYWSTLNAIALHHFSKVTGDVSYEDQSDGILRANFSLFTPEGRGSCAWIYPRSVNGQLAHYKDPYANDQDWALAHLLQIEDDNTWEEKGTIIL
ncbi:six-hairpin glycosidase [Colletotrichum higginsianum]|uniref:Six-hairpin glycosidase n=1 Tax=Colletotrichum higginsianum (strain IMI 349063) TaxID=759273 RepID=H1VD12_COLHI|nr:Six-hairpin glycosidase [Colletotrichum higginsianum IMI 349063]OBR09662.1 Six-hairpin glycosidase [Colletotrichum higginsianum IMI 349063]CCF38115.1 six-hairpin glycosidase [Colletotrichum higginsianum]